MMTLAQTSEIARQYRVTVLLSIQQWPLEQQTKFCLKMTVRAQVSIRSGDRNRRIVSLIWSLCLLPSSRHEWIRKSWRRQGNILHGHQRPKTQFTSKQQPTLVLEIVCSTSNWHPSASESRNGEEKWTKTTGLIDSYWSSRHIPNWDQWWGYGDIRHPGHSLCWRTLGPSETNLRAECTVMDQGT